MSEPREEDVKGLLGRAFGPEPPLALDRAEIFRQGRRTVRNRRIATAGGVAAGVIVAVLGAASLTNLIGSVNQDVATSSSAPALPTPSTPTTTGESAPPGPSLPLVPTTSLPAYAVHAETLTMTLAGEIVLSQFRLSPGADGARLPLAFVHGRDGYHAAADLTDALGVGHLAFQVSDAAADTAPVCEASSEEVTVICGIDQHYGYSITLTTRTSKTGTIEHIAHGIRGNTEVVVTATNKASGQDRPATRKNPPLDLDTVARLAANPYLTYR